MVSWMDPGPTSSSTTRGTEWRDQHWAGWLWGLWWKSETLTWSLTGEVTFLGEDEEASIMSLSSASMLSWRPEVLPHFFPGLQKAWTPSMISRAGGGMKFLKQELKLEVTPTRFLKAKLHLILFIFKKCGISWTCPRFMEQLVPNSFIGKVSQCLRNKS